MNDIKTDTLKLIEIINYFHEKQISCDQIVFWVGSGIDSIPPTNLPRAAELLESIMTRACGNSAKEILRLWGRIKTEVDSFRISQNEFSPLPRLETVIEQLMLCESNMKQQYSILPVIQCFQYAPPNINHYALANAIKLGANVVTTNYTFCIQSAFRTIMGGHYDFNLNNMHHIENSSTYVFESNYRPAGKIYHIHGIASEQTQLGASLNEVKKSLPTDFIKQLESWLSKGKIFIFCGYSGSDSFDVNRYFLGRKVSQFISTGIVIRHTQSNQQPPAPTRLREKEKILLRVFQKRYIVFADTSEFLSLFYYSRLNNYPNNEHLNFDWKTKCMDLYYPLIYHKNFCIQLCSFLGINASLILGDNWIPSLEEQKVYSHWYTYYPCFSMARLNDDYDQVYFWGNYLKSGDNADVIENLIHESLQSFDDYSYARIVKLEETTRSISSGIGWEISTYINQCTVYIINKFLYCENIEEINEVRSRFFNDAETLNKACINIINGGYDKILDMNQFHLSLRDAAILTAIFTLDFEKSYSLLQQSTYYYVEVSSIDGILGNLNSVQLIDFFNYLYNEDAAYSSDYWYMRVLKLCSIVDFKRHENIAKRIKVFIDKFVN